MLSFIPLRDAVHLLSYSFFRVCEEHNIFATLYSSLAAHDDQSLSPRSLRPNVAKKEYCIGNGHAFSSFRITSHAAFHFCPIPTELCRSSSTYAPPPAAGRRWPAGPCRRNRKWSSPSTSSPSGPSVPTSSPSSGTSPPKSASPR